MAGKRKGESASAEGGVSLSEIEALVQKAVTVAIEAATIALREEFSKFFEEVTRRLELAERRLCAVEAGLNDWSDRVTAIENQMEVHRRSREQAPTITAEQLENMRKEVRASRQKANENEQYSRRNNVRILGLKMRPDDECKQVVVDFCRSRLQLDRIESSNIDAAYILPISTSTRSQQVGVQPQSRPNSNSEPPVIVKFRRSQDRDAVLVNRKKLKGTGLGIVEDLTLLNVQTLNRVRNDDRVQTSWTWNGKIFAQLKTGRKVQVKALQPLDDCE